MFNLFFLIARVLFGGYFVAQGARYLSVERRPALSAKLNVRRMHLPEVYVIVFGLLMVFGGTAVTLGVFPRVGITMIAAAVVARAMTMHRFWRPTQRSTQLVEIGRFGRQLVLAGLLLSFLIVPQPWPFAALL